MNPQLLRSIMFGVWGLDETYHNALAPLVIKSLQGETVSFYEGKAEDYQPFAVNAANTARYSYYDGYKNAPEGSIAVIPVHGVITKNDQYCGPSGTVTLMKRISEAVENKNIVSIVLDVDSGGGEATNIATVANFIATQKETKAIYTHYSGLLCSAAYGIAVASTAIYANQSTDIVGSIGVFTSLVYMKKYYESQGLKIEDVYSDLSGDKNSIWKEAIEKDNFKPLKEKVLNPFAQSFHDSVKSHRPQINDKTLKGATYMSTEAIEMGLIDDVKTFDEVLQLAAESNTKSNSNNTNRTNMKYTKMLAVLGYSLNIDKDGGAFLQESELQKVEAALSEDVIPKSKTETALEKLTASVTDMNKSVTARFDAIEGRIEKVEGADGAAPAAPGAKANDEGAEKHSWERADDPINQQAMKDLGLA